MTRALRIQVPDRYFSHNADGVKDNLNFKVIAETSEAYSVQVKHNGATVKSWTGLTGEQNLSWDGLQNGQALANGNYRIVAMTERQKDRVRDAQMVVMDTVLPQAKRRCINLYSALDFVLKWTHVQLISSAPL
jgi:hypothetical protein